MTPEQERQHAQLAWLASGRPLEVGDRSALPLPLETLAATTADSECVVQAIGSGLTAFVYRLRAAGRDWTLKRQRPESLVKNVDGQTSFLNEVQRRADFTALKADPEQAPRFSHIVETRYASLRDGLILSPWIEGERLRRFDARVYTQLFGTIVDLELGGFFEWDLCPGNVLDDGERVTLFDFGYMYRFEPRQHYNNNGLATPLFHGIERFETRNFFGHLLRNPEGLDERGLLALFRKEKTAALAHYERKRERLEAMGAETHVLRWQEDINARWQRALSGEEALGRLYLVEGFRSHVLDLFDDLHGRSCTPTTLTRADWVLGALHEHFALLREEQGLFFGDEALSQPELVRKYEGLRDKAREYQLPR